jgi:hypothetical protein
MADFFCHEAVGAGVMAAAAKRLSLPRWLKNTAAIYGAVLGAWPDAGDWLAAFFGLYPRWELYVYYHRDAAWWWLAQPPFFLHVVVADPVFHLIPGWNWWPTLWSVELLWWYVAFTLLWYAYRVELCNAATWLWRQCVKLFSKGTP